MFYNRTIIKFIEVHCVSLFHFRKFLTSDIPNEVQFFAWAPEGNKLVSQCVADEAVKAGLGG